MINRKQATSFINDVTNKNIIKHLLASEVIMRALAKKFSENEEEWAMAGLLHDGDYNPQVPVNKQGIEITNILRSKGYEIPENVAYCMAAHNWHNTKSEPRSLMDWSLFIGDSLTGLIVATALVRPDKKLASVTVDSVLKKFKNPKFASGTRREDILLCQEKLGISLNEFMGICLSAMQSISSELGL